MQPTQKIVIDEWRQRNGYAFYDREEEMFIDKDGCHAEYSDKDFENFIWFAAGFPSNTRVSNILASAISPCRIEDEYRRFVIMNATILHPYSGNPIKGIDWENPIWDGADYDNYVEAVRQFNERLPVFDSDSVLNNFTSTDNFMRSSILGYSKYLMNSSSLS